MHYLGRASQGDLIEYAHQTESLKHAENIIKNGFDLSRIDATAKRHGAPASYSRHDPFGMFGMPRKTPRDPEQPIVTFNLKPDAQVLWHDMEGHDAKASIYETLDVSSRAEMTSKLLSMGVDAIASIGNHTEIIVLNFDAIEWTGYGLERDVKPAYQSMVNDATAKGATVQHQGNRPSPLR